MNTIDLAEMTAVLHRRTDTRHLRVVERDTENAVWPEDHYSFNGYYEVFDDTGSPDVPFSSIAEVYRWWQGQRWNASWRDDSGYTTIGRQFDTPAQALREAMAAWRYYHKEAQQ